MGKIEWIIIAIVLGVAIVAIVAAVVMKKKKGKAEIQVIRQSEVPVEKEKITEEKNADEEKIVDENLQIIVNGISKTADSFNGLYEGVFQIVQNPDSADSDAMDEWKIRVGNMNGNDDFKNAFLKLFGSGDLKSQAVNLLRYIELAGIKRAEETEYAFELNASKKYVCLSGNNLDAGTLCTVLKPYWYLDEKVIEQGCIIRREG